MEQNDANFEKGGILDNQQERNNMEALLEESLAIDFPKQGEIRTGMIASISHDQLLVSVGAKSEGIISGREYDNIPEDMRKGFSVGMEIPVFVLNPEDSNGNLVLSYTRAVEETSWEKVEALKNSGDVIESTIIGFNKGGLIVPVEIIRGFVPASQISSSRFNTGTVSTPEERYRGMLHEKISVKIIEVDRERRRLILSERAANPETRENMKDRVIDNLTEGDECVGRVTSLADFGAFVNINGADGLVHLSEISWEHIKHPSEILKIGQEVKVKVITIDRDRKRIGLSIRQLLSDPWHDLVANLKVNQLVEGKITRLTNFGAFARLVVDGVNTDLEGLIHISEISEKRIETPKEVLHEGDIVTLRVIKIEEDNHRIGLSMRKVDSPAYADLDWKTLAQEFNAEVGEVAEAAAAEVVAETKPAVAEEAPVVAEAPAVVEEAPVVAEAPAVVDETPEVEAEAPVADAADEDTKA